nr:hypothetical protein [Tanacetum cinerariifolium]
MCELTCQIVQKKLEEKRIEEEQAATTQNWKLPVCYDDDDDEEESNSLKDNIISELPPCSAFTSSEPTDSLSMGDEHLDTIPATESEKLIKSSVENLVPNPSESEDLLYACPHYGFIELHQLDTFYNALNPIDQDSLNSSAGGNLLERRTQDVLTIIENKSKVRNSRDNSIFSQVKSSDGNSFSSEIAKLTHAVNQQTSAVTTAMIAILKRFQATPPSAYVKSVEEICVTCGGAHPYYECLAANGNTFLEFQDNIQGYVSAATVNYNQGELKAITTQSSLVLDGPSVPMPHSFINPEEDERVEKTLTDQDLAKDPLLPNIPYPLRMHKQKQQDKDEMLKADALILIQKYQKILKADALIHINITLADALILIPKYQKMLKALHSNKEKLLKLANTPLNENCSAVILKKLPENLETLGNFSFRVVLVSTRLPELISTRMTLELANRAIYTPIGIAKDVFVPVGKFTFPADFVVVDYESDPRVPLILGRPFLRTARTLIDVHGEEIILHYGDEMRHDTSSYSNQPQKESINMINIYDDSCKDYLEYLFATNHQSGNPTFSSHTNLTSPEVINPLSGNTTSSFLDQLLEDFADELALITFPLGNDDLSFDIESDLREIEYLLNHDPTKEIDSILEDSVDESNLADPSVNLVDTIPEMFTDEHTLDYSSPPLYDDFDDDLFKLESDNDDVYNDLFDSKEDKIKESKHLIDELDPPRSKVPGSETLLSFSSENEDKVFKPGILNSKEVHTTLLPELSHRGPKVFKVIKILESPMEIFPCSHGEDIRILDVPCLHFYPT